MNNPDLRSQLAALHPLSFGWALVCCRGDRVRSEDVLQIAYLRVLDGRARFGGQSSFKTWLFGVIRNAAREERRRHLLRRAGLLRYEVRGSAPIDAEHHLARNETCEEIRSALYQLSARQQEVLHLVFYQALTIEQAAAAMAVSVGSARTHYERGKRQLRKRLRMRESDD